jgi:hypothetical protein
VGFLKPGLLFIVLLRARKVWWFGLSLRASVSLSSALWLVTVLLLLHFCFSRFVRNKAMMMFGSQIYEFSTFYLSFMECIKMALFDQGLDLVDLSAVNETQALLFYGLWLGCSSFYEILLMPAFPPLGTFMFISILLLLNIFLAILMVVLVVLE